MKIIVSGNTKFYQDWDFEAKVLIKKFVLEGTGRTFNSPLSFCAGNALIKNFTSKIDLYNFCSSIQGINLDSLRWEFYENNNPNYYNRIEYLKNASLQELGLIKSIFIIYPWIEHQIDNISTSKIESYIYDEFTLDYSSKLGPQKDIYFLEKKYINEYYAKNLEYLIEVNLLCKLEIEVDDKNWKTYFIPIIKPGVKEQVFRDSNQVKTYEIWKAIIRDRNIRIHQFVKRGI